MAQEVEAHDTSTHMVKSSPREVDAGTDITLKVSVSCPFACDLRGKSVRIIAQDGTVAKEVELASFEEETNETDEFTVKAPIELGTSMWRVVFPGQEVGGLLHGESSTRVMFTVKPHATSIAVWDIASPIAFNDKFRFKVGVKCAAECKLTDNKIEIYDHEGAKVAMGTLAGVPWPGTSALYWAEVELEAPGVEGYYRWRVKFREPDLELPHKEASYNFAFTTARPPECVVRIEVIDSDTKAPIENASVLLRRLLHRGHAYRSRTDDGGVARVSVPKGEYTLYASKGEKYETFQTTVEITDDASVEAELLVAPPRMGAF